MDSRYEPLRRFLSAHEGETVRMSFREIERVLGFALPPSARQYQAWWANDSKHSQAKSWIGAGTKSGQVDIAGQSVTFTRAMPYRNTDDTSKSVRTGKYRALGIYLGGHYGEEVAMTFSEIERVLGFSLPASARKHQAWWSNNPSNNTMTEVWLDAGFRTERVDVAGESVVFVRARERDMGSSNVGFGEAPSKTVDVPQPAPTQHPAIGSMKGMLTIMPGVDLTEPADPEWADIAYGDDE